MNTKVFYLFPQVEGKQEFVCWGFAHKDLNDARKEEIKTLVMDTLRDVAADNNKWVVGRSFSVLFGEDANDFWIALPRQIAVKMLALFNNKFNALDIPVKRLITSMKGNFIESCAFSAVISYDRGYIYDATRINSVVVNNDWQAMVVNG